jgi:hypothetical protein
VDTIRVFKTLASAQQLRIFGRMELRLIGRLIGLLILALALCSCGQGPLRPATLSADPMIALAATGSSSSLDADWRCPPGANVTPANAVSPTTNGHFTVCVNRQDSSRFLISGTSATNQLCAYPMRKTNSQTFLVESPRCFSITPSTGSQIDFAASDINFMAIVSANYTNQMNSCLSSTAACPAYSQGFVQ